MFDPLLVVQSAASSFNNAALAAPYFLWSALLAAPLFALVYFFGKDARLDIMRKPFIMPLCIDAIVLIWLIPMHGNYAVLRDAVSYLPFFIAVILFAVSASITQKLKIINPPVPEFVKKIKRKRLFAGIAAFFGIALVGFSGAPSFWGFMMQASAVFCGAIVGWRLERVVSPIAITSAVMFVLTTIILMQPEFFRFGQLGSLTIAHLLAVALAGVLAVAVVALRNINPCGRIHHSAFVKLKWMGRIFAGLCAVLFILTESVPVFLGLNAVLFVIFAISVWNAKSIPKNLSEKLWALLLCVSGIITSLPVLSALGVFYWAGLPKSGLWAQSKFLL